MLDDVIPGNRLDRGLARPTPVRVTPEKCLLEEAAAQGLRIRFLELERRPVPIPREFELGNRKNRIQHAVAQHVEHQARAYGEAVGGDRQEIGARVGRQVSTGALDL